MKQVLIGGVLALASAMLPACQSADAGRSGVAVAQSAEPDAAFQGESARRLKEQARAYAERLNRGRCETSPLVTEDGLAALDDALSAEDGRRELAEARLEIADAARIGGCSDIANAQYRTVLRSFPGAAYEVYRRRAEFGLSAMQL
jgi:hypothetical protein